MSSESIAHEAELILLILILVTNISQYIKVLTQLFHNASKPFYIVPKIHGNMHTHVYIPLIR